MLSNIGETLCQNLIKETFTCLTVEAYKTNDSSNKGRQKPSDLYISKESYN